MSLQLFLILAVVLILQIELARLKNSKMLVQIQENIKVMGKV